MLRNGGQNDEVQAGSGMPQSKAAKQAAIQQVLTLFVQNGVPIDERTCAGCCATSRSAASRTCSPTSSATSAR
jgi:hypothetical protein